MYFPPNAFVFAPNTPKLAPNNTVFEERKKNIHLYMLQIQHNKPLIPLYMPQKNVFAWNNNIFAQNASVLTQNTPMFFFIKYIFT